MITKLPALKDPPRYVGLYVFDFGIRASVGYTIEEIEILLSEKRYSGCEVYRIHRANPDGSLEIRGVNANTLSRATGLVFFFADAVAAKDAFEDLIDRAERQGPPGRVSVNLYFRDGNQLAYRLVVQYIEGLDAAVASWLLRIDFSPHVIVEGGPAAVTEAVTGADVIDHLDLDADESLRPRTREQVLADVDYAVQR